MLECHFSVAGAAFGDVAVPLLVAGAAFGDVGASRFVPGTVFGEIWVDSRSATCCNFPYAEARKVTSANGRIILGSCSDRPRIVNDASTVLGKFLLDLGVSFSWQANYGEFGGCCLLLRAL